MTLLYALGLCMAIYIVGRTGYRLIAAGVDLLITYFLPPRD